MSEIYYTRIYTDSTLYMPWGRRHDHVLERIAGVGTKPLYFRYDASACTLLLFKQNMQNLPRESRGELHAQ